jgi:hypothetical protein
MLCCHIELVMLGSDVSAAAAAAAAATPPPPAGTEENKVKKMEQGRY